MTSVGVVVRTKNEGRWVRYCLESLKQQRGVDRIEIALVDCDSDDQTVERACEVCPDLRLVRYQGEYFPGKSINMGIEALPDVDFIVVISAHCVPIGRDWLKKFITPLQQDDSIAASYCRQIPTNASTPENRRDLLNTFSIESRVQKKDSFFHNAASVIRRNVLSDIPFDDSLKHIEDRHWAERILNLGMTIFYNSECSVVHEHGLNQHDRKYRSFRGQGVSDLLKGDQELVASWEDFARTHSEVLVLALCSNVRSERMSDVFTNKQSNEVCFVLPKRGVDIEAGDGVISREKSWEDLSLFELLKVILRKFSASGKHFDYVYFFDADKDLYRGKVAGDYLKISVETGADLCVAVESYKEDFFVLQSDERSWVPVSDQMMDHYSKKPHFKKALYGEGMLIRSSFLISGKMPEAVFLDG